MIKRRLIFLNRYFLPDHSATSQILGDLAFDMVANGHDVHVVTSRLLYDDPKIRLPARETVEGVNVHRLPYGEPAARRDVPAGVFAAGNPCRVIRELAG